MSNDVIEGVILAGGNGTRLKPLTDTLNKHLLDIGGRRMLSYPLEALKLMGVKRVTVVTNAEGVSGFEDYLETEAIGVGMQINVVGQAEAKGIADALLVAEGSVQSKQMCVILGDQLMGLDMREACRLYCDGGQGAMMMLKPVPDPQRFGVALVREGEVVSLVEKPDQPESNLAVVGVYFYDRKVFDYCRQVKPSERGELEITDVNMRYIEAGQMCWEMLEGWWADVGTFDSLAYARRMVDQYGGNAKRQR